MPAPRQLEGVDRTARILEVLASDGRGLALGQIADSVDLPKSSTHRLLAALCERRLALQWETTGLYTLGPHFLALASRFHERVDLRVLAHPLIVRVSEAFDETVHMAILVGADIVYLDKVDSRHALNLSSSIGGRNPAHATALGKALLAWTYPSDEALAEWAAEHGPLQKRTKNTLTSAKQLTRALAEVRERGWSMESEESELGVRCVGRPLWFGEPAPRAAISISAPKDRLSDARLKKLVPAFSRMVEEAFPRE